MKESSTENFLRHVKELTSKAGVKLVFDPSQIVTFPDDPSYECAGYFMSHPDLVLCVAVGKRKQAWLQILVHEYSHFRQWLDKSDVWKEDVDNEGMINNWINKKIDLTKDKLERYIALSLDVELDAEKRSVEYIRKFSLPINEKTYIKKANASLMYYGMIADNRKWFDYTPFETRSVYRAMPDEFLEKDQYLNLSEKYVGLFRKNCFRKKK